MLRPHALSALLCLATLFAWGDASAQGDSDSLGTPVQFTSDDGVQLHGRVFLPEKGKDVQGAIVYVHEPKRTGRDWTYMADKMTEYGFYSLTFDLRGHGDSLMQGDEELDRELFGPEEFASMTADVAAALAHARTLEGVDPARVFLAGSDLGGSLAILAANADEQVHSVAVLSPGLGYDGVNMVKRVAEYGKRNLLLVYSAEDSYSRKSAEVFEKEARGGVHVEIYYGVGHGMKMLSREPRLENLLTSWFLGTVLTAEGRTLAESGQPLTQDKEVDAEIDEEAERARLKQQREETDATKAEAVGEEEERKRWQDEDD